MDLLRRTVRGELSELFGQATLTSDISHRTFGFGHVIDETATHQKQLQAAGQVAPVMATIYPGEVVVRRGDLVTQAVMEKLNALGLQSHKIGWRDILASTLFALVIVAMLFWYLHAYQPEIVANPRLLLLIDLSILIAVLGARVLSSGHVLLPFFLPIAALSTFAAVLMAADACMGLTLAMAMLAGWIVPDSFELTVYFFLTGAAGILAVFGGDRAAARAPLEESLAIARELDDGRAMGHALRANATARRSSAPKLRSSGRPPPQRRSAGRPH